MRVSEHLFIVRFGASYIGSELQQSLRAVSVVP